MVRRVGALFIVGWLWWSAVVAGRQTGAQAQPAAPPAGRFGVIESVENPAAAAELGVGWTRVTFHWAKMQPAGPASWQAPLPDAAVAAELTAGREIVGLLIGIPDWARDARRLPGGLELPDDHPDNLWAGFVRQVVGRYAGRINHWVIWNEPDIAATEIAHTWDGDVADFARLQQVAYRVAKAANPGAVIHLAAFTYWADVNRGTEQTMARLLDALLADPEAAAHGGFFDVATAHLYFQPDQVYALLDFFTGLMRQRGLAQPIWLVETNAPPMDDAAWPVPVPHLRVTQAEQAAYMPQAAAAALAAGAQRVAVYKLQDTADDRAANPEPFGLLRADGSRRPAFDAYRVVVQMLAQATVAERIRWDSVGQFRISQPDRETTVLFNRLFFDQAAAVPAVAPTARLVDQWGEGRVITATGGVYTVTLPASSCSHPIGDYCMIGGPTYYLVQAGDGGPPPDGPVPAATAAPSSTPPSPTATAPPAATPPIVPPRPSPTVTVGAAAAMPAAGVTTGAVAAAGEASPPATAPPSPAPPSPAPPSPAPARWPPALAAAGPILALAALAAVGVVAALLRRRRREP